MVRERAAEINHLSECSYVGSFDCVVAEELTKIDAETLDG